MSTALVIATWIAIGVLVAALALALLAIVGLLVRIRREAGSIVSAVRTIAERTSPIEEIVGDINDDLVAAREALDAVVGREEPFKVPRQRVEVAVPAGKREEDRGGLRGAVRSFMGKARDGSSAARGGGR